MQDPKRAVSLSPDELVAQAAAILDRVRTRTPRVHCITNAVAQNFSANMLLALGAVPSMTIAPDEVGEFAARADALLVNLGTFDAERRTAAEIAVRSVTGDGVPWLLDPVFIERSKPRTVFAKELLAQHPRAVRLNHAEFAALTGAGLSEPALRACALEYDTVLGPHRRDRSRHRRHAHRPHRQRASADGQDHGYGLRRLGDRGGLPRRRGRTPGAPRPRASFCSASPAKSPARAPPGPALLPPICLMPYMRLTARC